MIVLGIESSCDETSVAIVIDGKQVISEVTHSQISTHQAFGGVVPEIAAREHLSCIDEVVWKTLQEANLSWSDVQRIAVVNGPGLVSSLLVGITAAKTLAWSLGIELVSVNHLKAHVCANNLAPESPSPPFVCLLASGGHTQLIHVKSYQEFILLGESLDDSAGEAFDKVARLLSLGYPGGPAIQQIANKGNPQAFKLPRAKVGEFDFSFSGLKTAVLYLLRSLPDDFSRADVAASFQEVVCQDLADKLIKASKLTGCNQMVIAGGVAANSRLRELLALKGEGEFKLFAPPIAYCTDNGAMVAAAGHLCPEDFGCEFTAFSRSK